MIDREWWTAAFLVALAAIGGLLGSIVRMLDAKEPIHWFVVAVEFAVSAFAGLLVILLLQSLNVSLQLTGVCVGVCGWFGGRTTMVWLESRVRKVVSGDSQP